VKLRDVKFAYWKRKAELQTWFWKVSGLQQELDRRTKAMSNYLADQHSQAVRKERELLGSLINPLIRVRANYHLQDFNLSYTVTISDNLLFNSRNDRKALMDHLARQIAHELMIVQPIKSECDVPRSYRAH
jgi:hypothetical protein